MKKLGYISILLSTCLSVSAHAIEFWHSSTVWANQGMCSAQFTFDSGLEETNNLQITVTAINKAGKKAASGVLEIQQFGDSSVARYADAYLEDAAFCEDNLTIIVNKASAVIGGKRVDLLKAKSLAIRDFKPFKIRIGK